MIGNNRAIVDKFILDAAQYQYDAVLVISTSIDDRFIGHPLCGFIFNDKNKRFDDDTPVKTSKITHIVEISKSTFLICTQNTRYFTVIGDF